MRLFTGTQFAEGTMNTTSWFSYGAAVGTFYALLSANCLAQLPDEKPAASAGEVQSDESLLVASQTEIASNEAGDFCRCIGDTGSPSVAKINQALRGPLNSSGLNFVDLPLEEVVKFLQDQYGIPVQLDTAALEEIGLGADEPVGINLHNISLQSALRLMLTQLGLTSMIRSEVLMITTPEEAEAHLETCVYDVRELVDDTSARSFDALIDTIVSCVATQTWAENGGGEAEIRMLKPGLLVISQTQPVQNAVQGLLAEIREMRGDQPAIAENAAGMGATRVEPLVTRSYFLQIKQPADKPEHLQNELRELIVQSLPERRWKGKLDGGQGVFLAVLPDRIVVRHLQSVQDEVESLLADSGIATTTNPTKGGGVGGGFFQPAPSTD
jgi:hypothetical protein